MRWPVYFIFAYVAVGLQIGLGGHVRLYGGGVNFVLLAVVFIALNAPREAALVGCFVLGAMQDVVTQQPPGLYALSYGLAGIALMGVQQVIHREHPLTHAVAAFVGGLICVAVILTHGWIHPPAAARLIDEQTALPAIRVAAGSLLLTAVYTAALAPVVLGVLQRLRRGFAFASPRRSLKGM